MGRQLEMFAPALPDADDRLNAAQAEMRLAAMERESTRPRPARHRTVAAVRCPSCGRHVTIER